MHVELFEDVLIVFSDNNLIPNIRIIIFKNSLFEVRDFFINLILRCLLFLILIKLLEFTINIIIRHIHKLYCIFISFNLYIHILLNTLFLKFIKGEFVCVFIKFILMKIFYGFYLFKIWVYFINLIIQTKNLTIQNVLIIGNSLSNWQIKLSAN